MATFVAANGSRGRGYPRVNLDLIAKLRPILDGTGRVDAYACELPGGETVGMIDPSEIPLPGAVVPETRGTVLLGFHRWEDGDDPVYVARHPVVAWRITGDTAHPVIVDDMPDLYCLEQTAGPTTVWIFPFDAEFDTFDAAITHATKQLGIGAQPDPDCPRGEVAHA